MKFPSYVVFFFFLGWATDTASSQNVPELINYQGQIANQDGTPVPTGDYELTLSIYDAPTGGSAIWGPQKFNGMSGPGFGAKVPVVQGYFNLMIGPVDVQNRTISGAFTNRIRYVEIRVGTNVPISPRQQILSTPFAFRAEMANGVAPGSVSIEQFSSALAQDAVIPAGVVSAWAGQTAPSGWLLCDGSSVSRLAYSRLFQSIGTSHGRGDGSTTFNLPDYRGLFLRGVDSPTATHDSDAPTRQAMQPGGNVGLAVGSVQVDATAKNGMMLGGATSFASASHTHSAGSLTAHVSISGDRQLYIQRRNVGPWTVTHAQQSAANVNPSGIVETVGAIVEGNSDSASENASVSLISQDSETRPKNAYVHFIIKF